AQLKSPDPNAHLKGPELQSQSPEFNKRRLFTKRPFRQKLLHKAVPYYLQISPWMSKTSPNESE
ncbi:MAG: hypothetical protein J6W76_01340, partial [Spirochaetales bacterium]|nr:hypothetical protein [Spirochaetales bacterium]